MRAKREGVSSLLALFFPLLALPSSLLALDGLTFNGGQRIETGYCPTASDRFECEVTVNAVQPNASAAVFGTVREQEPERTFAFYVRQGGDDSSVVAYGDTARGGFFPRGKKVSLSVGPDGATWTWDGGSERLSLTPGFARDGMTPLLIGDANAARLVGDSVPAGTGAAMTLHRFRIWRGGLELVHDYEPCRNPSGEIGLYDALEKDANARFKRLEPQPENVLRNVPYRIWDDKSSTMIDLVCPSAYAVKENATRFEDGKWYAVTGTVSCGTIAVSGAAHLILCDDARLTADALTGGSLAVHGQPSGCGGLKVFGEVSASLSCDGGVLSAKTLAGESLAVVGGTLEADAVSSARKTIDGGSVKVGQTTFVNRANQPLYRVTVKVEGLRVEKLRVEGLKDYGTNDIYAIDDRVYLWLPKGTHRLSISDGTTTCRYCAVVKGVAITVEPLAPVGFFVNGIDIGSTGSGSGWDYTGKNLTLNAAGPYVLSGVATNDEVHIHVISPNAATVILSNAVVFASGLPSALNVDQNTSLLMAGGTSYLAATNNVAAVSVGPQAVLTVGFAPGADEAESMLGVFNYGDQAAIAGAGAVAVNGGTLAVWADRQAASVPLTRAADVFCMVVGSDPETARVVDKYNGEAYVLVTASVAPVTPGRPVGPFATAGAATNVLSIAFVEPSAPVSEVLTSGALQKTYCDMFALGVTGGDAAWFVEAALTPVARTNLAETANGATRQIPVAAIARLKPGVTTNVTAHGCAPGFYYSLYDGWALTNIIADANATNLNVLCGADAKVVFPEVKKSSEPAGFFKVGVDVTDNVGK